MVYPKSPQQYFTYLQRIQTNTADHLNIVSPRNGVYCACHPATPKYCGGSAPCIYRFQRIFSAYLTFHPLLRKRIALHDRTILIQPLAGVWGGAPTHGRPVRKPLKPHPLQNFISNARWKCAGSGTASRRRCREDSPAVRGKCHEVTKGDGPRAARSPCRGVGQSPALTG